MARVAVVGRRKALSHPTGNAARRGRRVWWAPLMLYAGGPVNILRLTANPPPSLRRGASPPSYPRPPEAAVSVIETRELRKSYGGIEALKGVSLRVEPGEVYGLLGQNGAGKTTLIKILLGLVHKTAGDAVLLDHPAGTVDVRRKVGYLPEDHRFPEYHTGYSLMDFYGQLYGLSRADRRRKIPEMLEVVGIKARADSRIR